MVTNIINLLTIWFIFGIGNSRQIYVEPPLCGKSVITNARFEDRTSATYLNTGLNDDLLPYVASVQKFDTDLKKKDGDTFDKRLSGAFVGTILGPTVVLVACRCVARHMGRVAGDEESTAYTRQFGVMAGTPWDYSPVDGTAGQFRFASRIVVHPKCELRPSLYLWDLAVLVLKFPFEFIQHKVEAAPIARTPKEFKKYVEDAIFGRMAVFTAAWGWAFNSHKPKNLDLKLHPLFIRDFDLCNRSKSGYLKAHTVPTNMHVCVETAASYLRLQRTGDVGSPLLGLLSVNESTKTLQYIVLGIKSEEDDATPDGFSLFTRLDIDLEWLWDIKRNPPDPRGTASSTNFASSLVLFIIIWARIWNIFG